MCFEILGTIKPDQILAIGDSIQTDVKGAEVAGIDALFIVNGIHRETIETDSSAPEAAAQLFRNYNVSPVGIMASLRR